MHPALYRTAQFFAALRAMFLAGTSGGLAAADEALVSTILVTLPQQRLFTRMLPNDQRHALAVACTLQQAGYNQPALLQAALLHDVAKSMGQPIIHRVLIVLLKAFWPAGLERISASGNPQIAIDHSSFPGWRRPFVIHAHHPAIGAAWAETAGCELLAVKLIARHQERLTGQPAGEEETLLAALQWADDSN